jgi:hypothetical protein
MTHRFRWSELVWRVVVIVVLGALGIRRVTRCADRPYAEAQREKFEAILRRDKELKEDADRFMRMTMSPYHTEKLNQKSNDYENIIYNYNSKLYIIKNLNELIKKRDQKLKKLNEDARRSNKAVRDLFDDWMTPEGMEALVHRLRAEIGSPGSPESLSPPKDASRADAAEPNRVPVNEGRPNETAPRGAAAECPGWAPAQKDVRKQPCSAHIKRQTRRGFR